MNVYKISIYTLLVIVLGCKPKFTKPNLTSGEIDATTFVSLGGSIAAGYSNGGVYYQAQKNSLSNLLATQLQLIGSADFKQPYVAESSIGIGNVNNAPSILSNRTDCQGVVSIGPVKIAAQGDVSIFSTNIFASQGPFNNLSVPDLKVIDADINGYNNPFFVRMASSNSSSILSDAILKKPTFFSLMLGLSDILNFALKGGTADFVTPVAGSVGVGFDASITNVLNKLTANGAKGIIANIPSIKTMAYFNTIYYNSLKLDNATATSLTNFYAVLSPTIQFNEGNNGFVIEDVNQPLGYRQAVNGELILLNVPLDSIKCNKMGSLIPIPDKYVLTLSEIATIENAITSYNTILKNLANSKKLAFVDVNEFFTKVKAGFVYNGVSVNASFVSGGFYSLDGLNLTPRGNALLANEFINAINSNYQSNIPQLVATSYSGIIFP